MSGRSMYENVSLIFSERTKEILSKCLSILKRNSIDLKRGVCYIQKVDDSRYKMVYVKKLLGYIDFRDESDKIFKQLIESVKKDLGKHFTVLLFPSEVNSRFSKNMIVYTDYEDFKPKKKELGKVLILTCTICNGEKLKVLPGFFLDLLESEMEERTRVLNNIVLNNCFNGSALKSTLNSCNLCSGSWELKSEGVNFILLTRKNQENRNTDIIKVVFGG